MKDGIKAAGHECTHGYIMGNGNMLVLSIHEFCDNLAILLKPIR